MSRKKITTEEIRKEIESVEGYRLLSDYKNSKDKMKIECDKGHIFYMKIGNFRGGARCKQCHVERETARKTLPYERVVKDVEARGYKMLTTEEDYNLTINDVVLECPQGHEWTTKLNRFRHGTNCLYCRINAPIPYEKVKEIFEKQGCKLLDSKIKLKEKVRYVCKCGSISETYVSDMRKGILCEDCYEERETETTIQMLGTRFEMLAKEIFEVLQYNYKFQYKIGIGRLRPDFYDEANNHIIDCKLSRWTVYNNKGSVDKYKPYCNKLSVLYLRDKEGEEYPDSDIEFISIKTLYPSLIEIDRAYLIYKVEQLRVEVGEVS